MTTVNQSEIVYMDTNEGIEKIAKDPTCTIIYNEVSEIIKNFEGQSRSDKLYSLINKYNDHYLVYYFLGVFLNPNDFNVSMACYKICLNKCPQFIDTYLNMAILYQKKGQHDLVKKVLLKANEIDNGDLRVLNFLGAVYHLEKDFYLSKKHYKKIISENKINSPSMKSIYNNLGFSYSAIGKCDKALDCFDIGLNYKCNMEINALIHIDTQLLQNKLLNYDYLYDLPENTFNNYLKLNELYKTKNECTRQLIYDKNKKIRIGFISPDLRHHVCAFFLDPIFKNFNKELFDVYLYSNSYEDDMSQKFKSYDGIKWFNILKWSVNDICKLILSHEIDILIDLAGQTNNNRLDVMSQKPAPIQMTYLGFPNTTGLTSIDYRITDKIADPIETTQKFAEKLLYMPRCFLCFSQLTNPLFDIPITYKPSNIIRFGIFNKLNKQNPYAFRTWKKIIEQMPNAMLCIKREMKTPEDIKIKYLKKIGLNDTQVQILSHVKDEMDYHKLYNEIDICLDTFPYSGTTTSCAGLLMSTPIITLNIPNRHVSNVTSSFLINMGYPELVAYSIDEYIIKAIKLAHDTNKLIYYKQNIRQSFIKLMNEKDFAKDFDNLMLSTIKKN